MKFNEKDPGAINLTLAKPDRGGLVSLNETSPLSAGYLLRPPEAKLIQLNGLVSDPGGGWSKPVPGL